MIDRQNMRGRKISIGAMLAPCLGDIGPYRESWAQAEELGVDRIFVSDHFHAQVLTSESFKESKTPPAVHGKIFEAATIQAAMAATTNRVEIGACVHAIGYRNPNLLADMARTIDHISGGRFILGVGSGYLEVDYKEYGYEWGTQKSRAMALQRDVPIIKARFENLNPGPLRKIPLLIAAMGNIGMQVAAEHADIWHLYGELNSIADRIDRMKDICATIGRDFMEIEIATSFAPHLVKTGDPDAYVALGITQIHATALGPAWDLGLVRELLQWRRHTTSSQKGGD